MAGSQSRYLDLPTGKPVTGVSGDAKSGVFDSEGFDDFTYDIGEQHNSVKQEQGTLAYYVECEKGRMVSNLYPSLFTLIWQIQRQ